MLELGFLEARPAGDLESSLALALAFFVLQWIVQWLFVRGIAWANFSLLASEAHQTIIARHSVDALAMLLLVFLGLKLQLQQGGFAFGADALFLYHPDAQKLCAITIGYNAKNLIDSLVHKDGILLTGHHIVTGTLACVGMLPYLHIYAAFFFGVSEISTFILCILVNFDAEHGVAALGERFPLVKMGLGVAFGIAFFLLRVVAWSYASSFFWTHSLAVLASGAGVERLGSLVPVYLFMGANAALSVLQAIWLVEIVQTAKKELLGGPVKAKKI